MEYREKFMKCKGECCPFCGSDEHLYIEVEVLVVSVGDIREQTACMKCKRSWRSIYNLVDVEEVVK